MRLAGGVELPPVVTWGRFTDEVLRWRQGEHVSILGPTGGGKTTLARALLPRRSAVVVLATKPADDSLDAFVRDGYRRVDYWPPEPDDGPRLIWWPAELRQLTHPGLSERYAEVIGRLFETGHWTIYLDEAVFLADHMRLERQLRMLWTQARSNRITVVASTQRPARVPVEMYSQPTHVFFFRHTEQRDIDRVADMGAGDRATIRATLPRLRRHQFLYVSLATGRMLRSTVALEGR